MAFISSGFRRKKLLHRSSSKAESSSPSPVMPCSLMNAGSQLRSAWCRARMTVARSNALARAASSRAWRACAAFCSFRSLRRASWRDASSAALLASRAEVSSQVARLGIKHSEGAGLKHRNALSRILLKSMSSCLVLVYLLGYVSPSFRKEEQCSAKVFVIEIRIERYNEFMSRVHG